MIILNKNHLWIRPANPGYQGRDANNYASLVNLGQSIFLRLGPTSLQWLNHQIGAQSN